MTPAGVTPEQIVAWLRNRCALYPPDPKPVMARQVLALCEAYEAQAQEVARLQAFVRDAEAIARRTIMTLERQKPPRLELTLSEQRHVIASAQGFGVA